MYRKGGDEPNVTVRLIGTTIIVILGLVMSQGMAEGAFSTLSKTTTDDFVKNQIKGNIKQACKQSGKQNFPADDNVTYTFNGVKEVRMAYHDEIGSDWYTFQIKYQGGSQKKYRLDSTGSLASWNCNSGGNTEKYRMNGSIQSSGWSESSGQYYQAEGGNNHLNCGGPCWVQIDKGQPLHVRVLEKTAGEVVNVQVMQ
jgi:hypothetical protein